MIDNNYLKRKENESIKEFMLRICSCKEEFGYNWHEAAEIVNVETLRNYTGDGLRCWYKRQRKSPDIIERNPSLEENSLASEYIEYRKNKVKLSDERVQINALYRSISREETIKEIAHDFAVQMNSKFELPQGKANKTSNKNSLYEGILLISDWHYGIDIDNYWGKYDTEIAKQRVADLLERVLEYIDIYKLKKLIVLNLGDLVAGRIHLRLRLNSRIDVISQIMEVSEILAEFLAKLSNKVEICYYSTTDNHSRIEPKKENSLDLESLNRITDWFLKERCPSIHVYDNFYDDDIATFNCMGFEVAAVHGHKDTQNKVIENITLMTRKHYDLICTAHLHHFSSDERNDTILVSNPSLMGTDDYAKDLRLCATPAQTLIIASEQNVVEGIHRIILN